MTRIGHSPPHWVARARSHTLKPFAGLQAASNRTWTAYLFDHFVGALEESFRDGEADRLRGLEIDHQFEPRRLHDRQVARFLALEDATDIYAGLPVEFALIGSTGSVAEQSA